MKNLFSFDNNLSKYLKIIVALNSFYCCNIKLIYKDKKFQYFNRKFW